MKDEVSTVLCIQQLNCLERAFPLKGRISTGPAVQSNFTLRAANHANLD